MAAGEGQSGQGPALLGMLADQFWRAADRRLRQVIESEVTRITAPVIRGGKLVASTLSGLIPLASLPAHKTTHESGGSDALTGSLDATARLQIATDGTLRGTRRRLNLLAGSGITLAGSDVPASEEVQVIIAGSAGASALPFKQTVLIGTGNKDTTSATFVPIDATNLSYLSLSCAAGDVVRCVLGCQAYLSATQVGCFDVEVRKPDTSTERVYQSAAWGAGVIGNDGSRHALTVVALYTVPSAGTYGFRPVFRGTGSVTVRVCNAAGTGADATAISFSVENLGQPVP